MSKGNSKIKKINWDKCNKEYRNMSYGICLHYCFSRKCMLSQKECDAYAKWDKKDGYLKK